MSIIIAQIPINRAIIYCEIRETEQKHFGLYQSILSKISQDEGVAQGLEQAAHNRLVVGSNPTALTIFYQNE